jgi:hypothetical protein
MRLSATEAILRQRMRWLLNNGMQGCGMNWLWPHLRYYSAICLWKRRKIMKDLNLDSGCSGHLANTNQKRQHFSLPVQWFDVNTNEWATAGRWACGIVYLGRSSLSLKMPYAKDCDAIFCGKFSAVVISMDMRFLPRHLCSEAVPYLRRLVAGFPPRRPSSIPDLVMWDLSWTK